MKVKKAYEKYNIPINLQKHMLRVAGIAKIACDNWIGKSIDKDAIIMCCLFHDTAKIINFDFSRPQLFDDREKDIDYWKKVQSNIIKKYGNKEINATVNICSEIGLKNKTIDLIKKLDWDNVCDVLAGEDWNSAVTIYSDMRVSPNGVVCLKKRFEELNNRGRLNKKHRRFGFKLENNILKNVKINLASIDSSTINLQFTRFLNLSIQ